ncbi:MAG: DUF2868 domain-containing protein [Akkermansiaceae bacterium]
MNSAPGKNRWKLADLIDSEYYLTDESQWRNAWRSGVREQIDAQPLDSEKARRRRGFRMMLESIREKEGDSPGEQVESGARLTGILLAVVMFLLGAGVVRGLLTDFSYQDVTFGGELVDLNGRGFNVWIFLMITLGVQWLFLIVGMLGCLLWRRWSGSMSWLQGIISAIAQKFSGGKIESSRWRAFLRSGAGKVWAWRMTRVLQAGGVGFNLGLLVGFAGCLMFLKVGFYWETTLPQFGEKTLNRTTEIISLKIRPGSQVINETKIGYRPTVDPDRIGISSISPRMRHHMRWANFFFWALLIWGVLPRVILLVLAAVGERRALASLSFQESYHRKIWRGLNSVSRGTITTTQSDGVIVFDVGGVELTNDDVRPYLLQELRVNPEKRYSLGTLDAAKGEAAMVAARKADSGIVFLVDGWNLSPKQMQNYHQTFRKSIGEGHMIRYVVIGSSDELKQWIKYVDSLRDSECEVHQYIEKR